MEALLMMPTTLAIMVGAVTGLVVSVLTAAFCFYLAADPRIVIAATWVSAIAVAASIAWISKKRT